MRQGIRKILACLLALLLLSGCSASPRAESNAQEAAPADSPEETAQEERVELIVFAAASLTETLEAIKPLYEQSHHVNLIYSFESSGTLQEQIARGAPCDLFLSAGQKQMDRLDAAADAGANPEGQDLILSHTRVNLLENQVTLCVPEGNPQGIDSFDTLARRLREGGLLMAMGNSDVPVGQYTRKILVWYGLDEEALAAAGEITYGSNVKEVTTWLSQGSVDCGVIYCTDAYSADGVTIVDRATAEMCGQVIYPAAVTGSSQHPEEAQAFLDYLQTDEAMAIFTRVGFSPAG